MSDVGAETGQRRRVLAAAPRLAAFDPDDYLRLNTDLAGQEPFTHFARFGAWEGRPFVSPERLTARLSTATTLAPRPWPLAMDSAARAWRAAATLQVRLRIPSPAPPALREAADGCRELLREVGVAARPGEGLGEAPPSAHGEILFDAAQLFGGAQPGGGAARRLSRAVVWIGARPEDAAFAAALPYGLAARAVICAEADAYALFAAAGASAVWIGRPPRDPIEAVAPPDHPLVAGLSRAVRAAPPGLPWRERPIALAALEDATPARSEAWSRMAEALAPVALVLRRPAGPQAHLPHEAELRRWIYARSQAVLHLHADAPRAVGMQAAAEAAEARAVLLAEPSAPHLVLRPDVHYVEASARRMPARLAALAADPQGSERMAASLAEALRGAFEPERLGLQLVLALTGGARAA